MLSKAFTLIYLSSVEYIYAVVADLSAMFVGVIQFSSQSTSLMVDEGVGIASLSVIRNPGSYGRVSVLYSVAAGK